MGVAVFGCLVHANTVITNDHLFGYRCNNPSKLGYTVNHFLWADMCAVLGLPRPDTRTTRPITKSEEFECELYGDRTPYRHCAQYLREINCLTPFNKMLELCDRAIDKWWGTNEEFDSFNEQHVNRLENPLFMVMEEIADFRSYHLWNIRHQYKQVTHIGVMP